ncbi:unnamed protein product [Heterobilharzia americana]|nr:unnamed protein product [Heterobilharzia americana]CAH8489918.1 unnamed protein product [Heterobilharzia americana]
MSEVTECFLCKITFVDQQAYWKHIFEQDCQDSSVNLNNTSCNQNALVKIASDNGSRIHKNMKSSDKESSYHGSIAKSTTLNSSKVSSLGKHLINRVYCDVCDRYMQSCHLVAHKKGKKHLAKAEKMGCCVSESCTSSDSVKRNLDASNSTTEYIRNPEKLRADGNLNHNSATISGCAHEDNLLRNDVNSYYIPGGPLPEYSIKPSENIPDETTTKSILRRLCMTEISSLLALIVGDMDHSSNFVTQMRMKCRNDLNSILLHEVPTLNATDNRAQESLVLNFREIENSQHTSLSHLLLLWTKELHSLDTD